MNENASDENTVTGKAMGNIMSIAASAAVLVGSAYAGTALLGKSVKGAKKVATKAKDIVSRKGASEEMNALGTRTRKIMKEEGVSGSKATRMAKKQIKQEAHAKKLEQLAEYDQQAATESTREAVEKNAKNPSVTMKKGSGKTIHTDKKPVDVTNNDLMEQMMSADDVKGYEEYLNNDIKQRKNREAVIESVDRRRQASPTMPGGRKGRKVVRGRGQNISDITNDLNGGSRTITDYTKVPKIDTGYNSEQIIRNAEKRNVNPNRRRRR